MVGRGIAAPSAQVFQDFALRIMLLSYSSLILLLMKTSSNPSRQDYILPKRKKEKEEEQEEQEEKEDSSQPASLLGLLCALASPVPVSRNTLPTDLIPFFTVSLP